MFSWDTGKALQNYDKHGVPFEEAATVFADPEALDWEDLEHVADRTTMEAPGGFSTGGRVLLVVDALRGLKNGTETIRIISARKASRKERQAYAG